VPSEAPAPVIVWCVEATLWTKLLDRLIEAACAVAVVALTVIVSLQVFNRFVLKTPLAWSEDLPCCSSSGWSS